VFICDFSQAADNVIVFGTGPRYLSYQNPTDVHTAPSYELDSGFFVNAWVKPNAGNVESVLWGLIDTTTGGGWAVILSGVRVYEPTRLTYFIHRD